jgi:uncharacterized membrane protein YedE/YeeE
MMRKAFGALLLLAAGLFLALVVLALLDPAGTQLANDADPLGTPAGPKFYAAWFAVIAGFAGVGLWMILGGRGKRRAIHPQVRG